MLYIHTHLYIHTLRGTLLQAWHKLSGHQSKLVYPCYLLQKPLGTFSKPGPLPAQCPPPPLLSLSRPHCFFLVFSMFTISVFLLISLAKPHWVLFSPSLEPYLPLGTPPPFLPITRLHPFHPLADPTCYLSLYITNPSE